MANSTLRSEVFVGNVLGSLSPAVIELDDLFDLLLIQMKDLTRWDATPYNVGGGRKISVSLRALTALLLRAFFTAPRST